LAPIALFVYNRPLHTKKTISALQENILASASELYIFSDGAKNSADQSSVNQIRSLIKETSGFRKTVTIERPTNLGVDDSIITGVSELLASYGRVIVIEDDIVTSKSFLNFMNEMLTRFESDRRVFQVGGYTLPESIFKMPNGYSSDIYFHPRSCSWGWATWRDRWRSIDWEVKDFDSFWNSKKARRMFDVGGRDLSIMLARGLKSEKNFGNPWDIRFCFSQFKHHALTVLPTRSYVNNIGHDESGVHCQTTDMFNHRILNESVNTRGDIETVADPRIIKKFMQMDRKNSFKIHTINAMRYLNIYSAYTKSKEIYSRLIGS
jgi:hypothetical protein